MPSLKHIVIAASAGSGKTYQLVRRYLHLMCLGVPPQRIAAMTFTRKASGEFFNRILNRLADLAEGRLQPDEFFIGMEPRPPAWPDFAVLLRDTVQSMHQLRLGTLDSFFANITACFPLELGLPLGASVMAEPDAEQAQKDALASMIEQAFRDQDEAAERAIVEAFKQATFGSEEKRAVDSLMAWINAGHERWLESDAEQVWGLPSTIWPDGKAAARRPLPDLAACIAKLRSAFNAESTFTEKGAIAWNEMIEELILTDPGLKLPKSTSAFLTTCANAWSELRAGNAKISFASNRNKSVSGLAAQAMVDVAECLLARELLVRCARTRGMSQMLARYEAAYARSVRNAGRLSFADVQRQLGVAASEFLHEAAGAAFWYRLDARYDHWLFDEFQDTSFHQWHVMQGLVNEVLQSDSGERSFFAVGDPKQSIYLWRQAEPRLFQQIMDDHPPGDGRGVHVQQLSDSRRSAPEVLEAVNLVCGAANDLAELLPGASQLWQFQRHASATSLKGYAALVWPEQSGDGEKAKAYDVTLRLLREVQPLARGMTCAVLMRSNPHARELADLIRAELGVEVVCESEQQPCTDNAITLALLSVLQLAAHPGDSFALEHLRMTPLTMENWHDSIRETQRIVCDEGFGGFVKLWAPRVRTAMGGTMDRFSEMRLDQFADFAATFDESGSRDLDAFITQARGHTLRTRGATAAIQVMTIHASKGLEFDMVVLPELSGKALNALKPRPFIVKRDAEGHVDWVLQEPPKDYVALDATLSEERADTERRSEFESLCRLYVAMTRAKRGLYLVLETPPKDGKSTNESRLLRELLCTAEPRSEVLIDLPTAWGWECGNRRWYEADELITAHESEAPPSTLNLGELLRASQPMPQRRTPSGEESFLVKGKVVWSTGRDPGRQLGSLVHKLLEQVTWIGDRFDVAALEQRWADLGLAADAAYEAAKGHALRAIERCPEAFTAPDAQALVWRERPFDLMLGSDQWISGTVDRVNVDVTHRRAEIIDFKTDDAPDDTAVQNKIEGYRPQMALYQQAVQRLTGFAEADIHVSLLFTRLGRLVQVF